MEITNQHITLANAYDSFKTTPVVDSDLKSIRKLNVLLCKLDKTDHDRYAHEVVNLLVGISNSLNLNAIRLLIMESIGFEHHDTVNLLVDVITTSDEETLRSFLSSFRG